MNFSLLRKRMLTVMLVAVSIALPASATFLQLVSLRDNSLPPVASGGGLSGMPILSSDGRYVLFASTANNLVMMSDGEPMPVGIIQHLNVFLRDRANNTTVLVSVNLAGIGGGNDDSTPVGISTNGQYVLFESAAGDLTANDTNGFNDIFIRDLVAGTTTLVSVNTNGVGGNGASRSSVMTPDGRYVSFVSDSSDLVAADSNGIADVFIRDLQNQAATLVSVGAQSTALGGLAASSESPGITPDGRYVAFYSSATNLVPGLTNSGEVYVRDLIAGNTIWASTNGRAIFKSVTGGNNVVSCEGSISADGTYVAFEACTNSPSGNSARGVVLRYNLLTGATDIVHTNANVPSPNFADINNLAMTPGGRFVVFVANVGDGSGTNTSVELWDAQTGLNTLVSVDANNVGPGGGWCDSPVVSTNGNFVAFASDGTNLSANPLMGDYHIYLRDIRGGATTLIDVDTNGAGSDIDSTFECSMSDDGRFVAFDNSNGTLVANDGNRDYDAFVRDTTAQTTELISMRDPVLPSSTPSGGPSLITPYSVSANGRYVAYGSEAGDVVPAIGTFGFNVFVRDLMSGSNILVSVNTNGDISGNAGSYDPAISADGRQVAFTSSASDLIPNDNNNAQDIFVRDLQGGSTTLVSVSTDGVTPGNGDSFSPIISSDGRYVLFHSKASNLASGYFGTGIENLFFRDLQTGTTYALTSGTSGTGVYSAAMTPDGRSVVFSGSVSGVPANLFVWDSQLESLVYTYSTAAINAVGISPDGNRLAFASSTQLYVADRSANTTATISSIQPSSHPGLNFNGNGQFLVYAGTNQVFLYDFQAGASQLVSKNPNTSAPGNDSSDSPVISADGRFVAYRSAASDLVTTDGNGVPDVFVYDRLSGSTSLLSISTSGSGSGDNRSLTPTFSADGHTLVFTSWASDLAVNDFNQYSDVFAYEFFYVNIAPSLNPVQGPTIAWSYVSGYNYQVESKDNLSDTAWLPVAGSVVVNGNQASLTDLTPSSNQRFYRVEALPVSNL